MEVAKMVKNITIKMLRPRLPKVIDDIDSKMDRFIVTKRGRPVALMMAIDDYESLLETVDMLSDKKLVKRIKKAESDVRKGNYRSLESIEKELGVV
jgi:prevent-host-death family protein